MSVLRLAEGAVVCERCELADTPLKRMKGLLGRAGLASGEGLLIRPTGSIHTLFMRFPIDAIFCDRELHVLKIVREMGPWRFAAARGARVVVELPADSTAGVAVGDRLVLEPAGPESA